MSTPPTSDELLYAIRIIFFDLRNQLSSIRVYSELIADREEFDRERLVDFGRRIKSHADRMRQMMDSYSEHLFRPGNPPAQEASNISNQDGPSL